MVEVSVSGEEAQNDDSCDSKDGPFSAHQEVLVVRRHNLRTDAVLDYSLEPDFTQYDWIVVSIVERVLVDLSGLSLLGLTGLAGLRLLHFLVEFLLVSKVSRSEGIVGGSSVGLDGSSIG